jgi:uncharacterized membrane protein YbhN (UPF0104 family)
MDDAVGGFARYHRNRDTSSPAAAGASMRYYVMLFSAVVGSVSAAMLFGLIWVALFLMKAPLSDWPMGWLLAAVALLGGVLGVFKEIADQRRTEANRDLAAKLKLSYTENSRSWMASPAGRPRAARQTL